MRTATGDPFPLIDSRALRTNQALVAVLVLAAWLAGQPWVLAALSLALYVGVSAGRRWIALAP